MDLTNLYMLIILSLLAALMIIWYYYWRRRMIWLTRNIVIALENTLKPVDKNYVLLGYLVGFKAEFKLDSSGKRKAYSMLLLLPRYSLLYYPIARFFTSKIDRLDILLKDVELKPRRCHIVSKKWFKLLRQDHLSVDGLRRETIEHGGEEYHVYYEDTRDRDLLVNLLVSRGNRYIRISSIPEENAVLLTMKANPDAVEEAVRDLARMLRDLSRQYSST